MDKKEISRATYLQALGLFTMAQRHAKKSDEFMNELAALLDNRSDGHLSDAIYDHRATFDESLTRDGFVVAQEKSS